MIRNILNLSLILYSSVVFSQPVNFLWAKDMSGANASKAFSVATDAAGNVYTTGWFVDAIDFDPGSGVYTLTSVNGSTDAFISKLDVNGNFVWAKQFGANGNQIGFAITVDDSGNVYTTGTFINTVDFDPGAGTYTLTGNSDVFISKLDKNGNFAWARSLGGTAATDIPTSIALDTAGHLYTTGYFMGTSDFDPGVGVYTLATAGQEDVFISKLDTSGNFVWAKRVGGTGSDFGKCAQIDPVGNVYVIGFFNNTVDFDPGASVHTVTSAGAEDIYILKLDTGGNFIRLHTIGGTGTEHGNSVASDPLGNIYITGEFGGSCDLDPGPGVFTVTPSNSSDMFISKLDSSGNFRWAKTFIGGFPTYVTSVTTDVMGGVYTTGRITGIVDFDPGAGTYNLTASSGGIFISKLDSSGNFAWAAEVDAQDSPDITLDNTGSVLTTGSFYGTIDFDPGAPVYNLSGMGTFDNIFVHKMGQSTMAIQSTVFSGDLTVYPNPVSHLVHIRIPAAVEGSEIIVSDLLGNDLLHKNTEVSTTKIDLSGLRDGFYIISIRLNKKTVKAKILVTR